MRAISYFASFVATFVSFSYRADLSKISRKRAESYAVFQLRRLHCSFVARKTHPRIFIPTRRDDAPCRANMISIWSMKSISPDRAILADTWPRACSPHIARGYRLKCMAVICMRAIANISDVEYRELSASLFHLIAKNIRLIIDNDSNGSMSVLIRRRVKLMLPRAVSASAGLMNPMPRLAF